MNKPVIAIGLDAAEPKLIEQWIEQGLLKNLAKLKSKGAYGRLQNFASYRAETPWTTFLTGCSPETTGYWGPVKLKDGTYKVDAVGAYNYGDYGPFYALGKDYKVAVFDMPQAPLAEDTQGIQILGWGAHSPQTPSHSLPVGKLQEVIQRHGTHPAFGHDHANIYSPKQVDRLHGELQEGIRRRSEICKDLLSQDDWNLFLTIYGETHSGGHCLLHLNDTHHPVYRRQGNSPTDYLLETYQKIDESIGEILAAAPQDSSVIVFSAHGMQANNLDLTSTFFLGELMYRWNFPGKVGFAATPTQAPPGRLSSWRQQQRSYRDIWSQKHDPNPVTRWIRAVTPTKIHRIYAGLLDRFGLASKSDFVSPYQLQNQDGSFDWQPVSWYAPSWHKMKAFALPSFSEGYIRINLKGREPNGCVDPKDYDRVCDEVITQIESLRSVETGKSVVESIIRTRNADNRCAPGMPDADLIVMWDETELTDCVESDRFGRMGPVPYQRAGSHTPHGFVLVKDESVKPGSDLQEGHVLDLAPTILDLMDAPKPSHLEGHSLLQTVPVLISN